MSVGIYRSRQSVVEVREWCQRRVAAWPARYAHDTVPTVAGETAVLSAGSGPTVLLLPGTNVSSAVSLELVDALARRSTVVAVDLPGQPGLSAAHRPQHYGSSYGEWLQDLLGRLSLPGAVVVGHSLGAAVALAGAARGAPVSALVLYNPAGLVRLRVTPGVLAATLPWLVHPSPPASQRLLSTMTTAPVPQHMTEWMTLVGRHVRSSLAPAPLPASTLRQVRCPVSVHLADADPFLPPAAVRRGALPLPDAGCHLARGAGHMLPHERPEHVAAAVHAVR